jgi:hypothetical protein
VPHRHILFWAMNDSSTIVSETSPEASAAPTRGCPPFHYLCFVCPKLLPPSSSMSSRAPPLTPSTLMTTTPTSPTEGMWRRRSPWRAMGSRSTTHSEGTPSSPPSSSPTAAMEALSYRRPTRCERRGSCSGHHFPD